MSAAVLDDFPPDLRARVASLGYELERWSVARSVLAARLAKHRVPPAVELFLTTWTRDNAFTSLEVTLGETTEGWRLLRGGLGEFAVERALLHLPVLRSFWVQELRQAHFDALRKWVPEAWILDDSPLPKGAVIAGLGIPSWQEFPRRHDSGSFAVEDREGMLRDVTGAEWNALVEARSSVLVRRIHPIRRIGASFLRDERSRIVLQHAAALS